MDAPVLALTDRLSTPLNDTLRLLSSFQYRSTAKDCRNQPIGTTSAVAYTLLLTKAARVRARAEETRSPRDIAFVIACPLLALIPAASPTRLSSVTNMTMASIQTIVDYIRGVPRKPRVAPDRVADSATVELAPPIVTSQSRRSRRGFSAKSGRHLCPQRSRLASSRPLPVPQADRPPATTRGGALAPADSRRRQGAPSSSPYPPTTLRRSSERAAATVSLHKRRGKHRGRRHPIHSSMPATSESQAERRRRSTVRH